MTKNRIYYKLINTLLSLLTTVTGVCLNITPLSAVYNTTSVEIIRLFNNKTGQHLYTADQNEITALTDQGWTDEGTAFTALTNSDNPVYRIFNPESGVHFLTQNYFEYKQLCQNAWLDEGIAFYSDPSQSVPVYRLFNPYGSLNSHLFTASDQERSILISQGWIDEGIAWFGSGNRNGSLPVSSIDLFKESHPVVEANDAYTSYQLPFVRNNMHIYGELYLPEESSSSYPLVIISHGFNNTHEYTGQIAADFAQRGIAAYVFDFLGGSQNSLSDGSFYDMSVLTEKDDLETILKGLKNLSFIDTNDIFLLGESQGGLVSALTAADHVKEIKGLVLYYPAFSLPDDARKKYKDADHIPDHPTSYLNTEVGRKYFEDIINIDTYSEIEDYTGPVLILHGSEDNLVPLSSSRKAKSVYKNCILHIRKGVGHGFHGNNLVLADDESIDFVQNLAKK